MKKQSTIEVDDLNLFYDKDGKLLKDHEGNKIKHATIGLGEDTEVVTFKKNPKRDGLVVVRHVDRNE
jgi:hypothetical protein